MRKHFMYFKGGFQIELLTSFVQCTQMLERSSKFQKNSYILTTEAVLPIDGYIWSFRVCNGLQIIFKSR